MAEKIAHKNQSLEAGMRCPIVSLLISRDFLTNVGASIGTVSSRGGRRHLLCLDAAG
jgi:hypothetical protein